MNTLPDELLSLIFQHLDLIDLYHCRLVDRRFKFFIDDVQLTELIIQNPLINYSIFKKHKTLFKNKSNWRHSNRSISKRNTLRLNDLKQLERFPFNLDRLKRLLINIEFKNEHFQLINKFKNLEQLEIKQINISHQLLINSNDDFSLSLTKLKVLALLDGCLNFKISMNLPNLTIFDGGKIDLDLFRLLNLNVFKNSQSFAINQTNKFNSSKLAFIKFKFNLDLNEHFLDSFPNLKELYINLTHIYNRAYFVLVNSTMNRLIDQRTLLNYNLKIFFNNVELIGNANFESYGTFNIKFHSANLSSSDSSASNSLSPTNSSLNHFLRTQNFTVGSASPTDCCCILI